MHPGRALRKLYLIVLCGPEGKNKLTSRTIHTHPVTEYIFHLARKQHLQRALASWSLVLLFLTLKPSKNSYGIMLIDKIFFSVTLISIYFRYQSILIGGLILTISIDFRFRFLSINYIWGLIRALISNWHTKRIMGSYEKRFLAGGRGGGGVG